MTSKITPFLWFNDNAEEAANFYLSIFKDSKILEIKRYGEAGPGRAGSVMVVEFELDGQTFTALNGGPRFKFTEAVSFVVRCDDQKEIDYYWDALTAGADEGQCGWLKDKFGVSWQVVPKNIGELMSAPGAVKALMTMKKLDIAVLKEASAGQ